VEEKDGGVWQRSRERLCAFDAVVGFAKCARGETEFGVVFRAGFVVWLLRRRAMLWLGS
jgi:hypothetical protein